jgi:hypothetical protein
LLYVVELNIVTPNNRLYQEICAESEATLRNLSMALLGHENAARVIVRIGRADEQILAEASASRSELIILTSSKRRWSHPFRSRTVERVVQSAPCPTLVLPLSSPIASGECQPEAHRAKSSGHRNLRAEGQHTALATLCPLRAKYSPTTVARF